MNDKCLISPSKIGCKAFISIIEYIAINPLKKITALSFNCFKIFKISSTPGSYTYPSLVKYPCNTSQQYRALIVRSFESNQAILHGNITFVVMRNSQHFLNCLRLKDALGEWKKL
jgi:hypothetical protein